MNACSDSPIDNFIKSSCNVRHIGRLDYGEYCELWSQVINQTVDFMLASLQSTSRGVLSTWKIKASSGGQKAR